MPAQIVNGMRASFVPSAEAGRISLQGNVAAMARIYAFLRGLPIRRKKLNPTVLGTAQLQSRTHRCDGACRQVRVGRLDGARLCRTHRPETRSTFGPEACRTGPGLSRCEAGSANTPGSPKACDDLVYSGGKRRRSGCARRRSRSSCSMPSASLLLLINTNALLLVGGAIALFAVVAYFEVRR